MRYLVMTHVSPDDVIRRAKEYFAANGYELRATCSGGFAPGGTNFIVSNAFNITRSRSPRVTDEPACCSVARVTAMMPLISSSTAT